MIQATTFSELEDEIERLRTWLLLISEGEHSHVVHGVYAEPCHVDCPVFNAKCALRGDN